MRGLEDVHLEVDYQVRGVRPAPAEVDYLKEFLSRNLKKRKNRWQVPADPLSGGAAANNKKGYEERPGVRTLFRPDVRHPDIEWIGWKENYGKTYEELSLLDL